MKRLCTMFAALAVLSLNPVVAAAQEAAKAETQGAHARLFTAMESGIDQEQVLTISTHTVATQILASLPADMTEGHPGMQLALAQALRKPMRNYSQRIAAEYRPRMIAAIASVMSPSESDALTEFYSSELGRRVLASAATNLSVENMAADGLPDMRVETESVERDLMETGIRAFGALSAADQSEVLRISLTTPGFAKMPLLQSAIAPIRAEMESSPPTGAEASAIQQAVFEVMQQYAE